MKPFWISAGCALASYLLGSVPFGYLVARLKGMDIRRHGSGNIGATNVFRCVGKGWGLLTFACDTLKGFGAAFLIPRVAAPFLPPDGLQALGIGCACLAVAGHNWPAFLRFKGGKGVATSAGVLLARRKPEKRWAANAGFSLERGAGISQVWFITKFG